MRVDASDGLKRREPAGVVDVGGWVAPAMELIYEQGTPAFRGQWPRIEQMLELAAPRVGRGDWSHPSLELPMIASGPAREDAWARLDGGRPRGAAAAVADGVLHDNPAGRADALARAGIALQLINPGPSLDACLGLPANLAGGVFAAYNQYIVDYCHGHDSLGAVLQLHGSEPRWSAQEVADLKDDPAVRAASVCLAVRIAPDERQFDPLWESLQEADLPLLHRPTFSARVWSPGRLVSYLRAAGVLERFPGLRVGFIDGAGGRSADDLARALARSSAGDAAVAERLFAVASTAQLERQSEPNGTVLWASDYPLGEALGVDIARMRATLGADADRALVAAPRRFLGVRAGQPE